MILLSKLTLLLGNLNPLTINEIFHDEGFFVFRSNTLRLRDGGQRNWFSNAFQSDNVSVDSVVLAT